ncbi:hypothetical protein [Roseateles amylovorans]|uniref:Uncharacterized protein n=1 Tax=Roseateles amylovorans TaxID=2978473 RepID=A0ABY6B6E9_9BURK|nr:hypothetical protein [Roseateles amylovorans]UXH80085.1 hypothetical protein N4261_09470 [Roseateles amylovorans]
MAVLAALSVVGMAEGALKREAMALEFISARGWMLRMPDGVVFVGDMQRHLYNRCKSRKQCVSA